MARPLTHPAAASLTTPRTGGTLADDIASRRRGWVNRQATDRLPRYEPHGWGEADWDTYGDILAEDHTLAVGAGVEARCGAPWCGCVHLPVPDGPVTEVPDYLADETPPARTLRRAPRGA